jgi:hypothetical protein
LILPGIYAEIDMGGVLLLRDSTVIAELGDQGQIVVIVA